MRLSDTVLISILAVVASAGPLVGRDDATYAKNKREITEFFNSRTAQLKIVKTTKTPEGQTIDWIPIESQGDIASPPPALKGFEIDPTRPEKDAFSELLDASADLGPPGTVPVLHPNLNGIDFSKTSLDDLLSKIPGLSSSQKKQKRDDFSLHAWAMANQYDTNFGAQGHFSLNSPTIEPYDFSLTQTAIVRQGGASEHLSPKALSTDQTVEAGLIVFNSRFGDYKTHLFSFFNTNGYAEAGDYIKSWNQDYWGWKQYDDKIFPGTVFSPPSVIGGAQYKVHISYQLYNDNWWLWVKDRWIGYYPASMFRAGRTTSKTLSDHSDRMAFYTEVYDSKDPDSRVTTSDMGSGKFPSSGWTNSAFINRIIFQANRDNSMPFKHFSGAADLISDKTKWDMEPHFSSSPVGTWGSYCYVGGPGRSG